MKNEFDIAVFPGDGIGPEVVAEAIKVLRVIESKLDLKITLNEAPVGGAGYEATGKPLPDVSLELAKKADGVLLLSLIHI